MTFFPNYSVALKDSNLSTALKVQVQITGAEQVPSSVMGTLHHQMVYRMQNHALDLQNCGTNDALMVVAESGDKVPTIVQIPRQLKRTDLIKLMPTEWITNYESLHQIHKPVQTTDPYFQKMADGKTKTVYTIPDEEDTTSQSLFPQIMITLPVPEEPDIPLYDPDIPIHSFNPDGTCCYTDQINGHFIWDVLRHV